MPRRLCGCSPTRRDCRSTIHECAHAARATGADVLACLSPQARMMSGIGDQLGPAIPLPKIFAVLVNPQVQAPTPKVFAALGLAPGSTPEIVRAVVRCARDPVRGHPGFSRLRPERPGSRGGPHSAGNRRSCARDWRRSRRLSRRECPDRERLALPCSEIVAVRRWRGASSPQNARIGGSRQPPSISSTYQENRTVSAWRPMTLISTPGGWRPNAGSDRLAFTILAGFFVARLAFAFSLGLGIDESYTIAISRRLGLSYFDHPPLHLWIAHFAALAVGENVGRARRPSSRFSSPRVGSTTD